MENEHMEALKASLMDKLDSVKLPRESITVFGRAKVNVHVRCLGQETAKKWAALLAKIAGKAPVIAPSAWDAKHNKGTVLKPTLIKGYLVAVSI
jgi:hypothetical protein